jgi:hypothetical protein
MSPTVGVVVVNYNGGERVLRVLQALEAQSYGLHEILVVDNASSDGTPAAIRARFPAVRLIELPDNLGLSVARNVGLQELHSTLALSLDHDIYVDPECIDLLVRAHLATNATVICPRIRLLPERETVHADGASVHFLGALTLRHAFVSVADAPAIAGYVGGAIGACMLLHRARVLDAGGFDELIFFYQEDLEFSLRLRVAGHRYWCEPAAEVYHERSAGTPGLSFRGSGAYPRRRAHYTMRHRLFALLIHYRLRTLLVLSPVLVLTELAALASALVKGWPAEWFRSWFWVLGNLPALRARRRQSQQRRTVDDKDLLTGGVPPVAQGFLTSGTERRIANWHSSLANGYWRLVRSRIG